MLLSELCESNGPRSFCTMTMLDFFFPPPAEEGQRRKPVSMSLASSVDARKAGAEVDAPPAPPAELPAPPVEPAPPPPGDDDDVCRVCFDVVGENADDALIAPCRCAGTMKYVHRSCLDACRVSGFDPSSLTRCGLCKADYVLEDATRAPSARLGPRGELALTVARYLGLRVLAFVAAAGVLGFAPRVVLGRRAARALPRLSERAVVHHLSVGSLSALVASGVYAFASVVGPANLAHNFAFRRRFSSRKDDNIQTALVLLAVVGACYLLYHLGAALYQFARTGLPHAVDNVRSANRDVRRRIAERWRVVDRDPRREEGPPS